MTDAARERVVRREKEMAMRRIIVGRFSSYQDARDTMNELVRHNVDREQMSLVAPRIQAVEDTEGKPTQGGATEMNSGLGALAVTGAATVALTGAGIALLGAPLAALAGAQMGQEEEETEEDRRFQRMLIGANIAVSAQDAQAYIEDVRAGSSILAVEVADQQEDIAAEIFHRYGGRGLTFRRLEP